MSGEGRKNDQGKLPLHLVPWDAVKAITTILAFGAEKYAPRNWELGMDWSRVHSAALRHLIAWWEGERQDPETGYSHLWHAGCCLLFLIAYEIRGVGRDDRPTSEAAEPAVPVGDLSGPSVDYRLADPGDTTDHRDAADSLA